MLVRIYTVHAANGEKKVPQLVIQGRWLETWGFGAGKEYSVEMHKNELVLRPVVCKDGKYVHEAGQSPKQ